ncbi:MAG: lysophospholipid acyltransferase family protein [Planctomycetota bacterium]
MDLTLRAPYAAGEILHKPLGDAFRVSMDPRAQELAAAGSPVVFVGCHVGHWELAGIALATLGFQPIYAVGKAPRNDYLSRSMQKAREAQGGRMLPRKDAMKSVPGVLRGGGSVIFLLDHRARSKPVYAPFFGRPAACERSASVLFRRLGVPIVFYACYGGEGPEPYEIVVGPVLEPADLAGLGPEAISARVNAEFETQIRRRPKQYFWLHDRYQHTPRTFEELAAQESGANTADAAP